jgi:hypothetical protein
LPQLFALRISHIDLNWLRKQALSQCYPAETVQQHPGPLPDLALPLLVLQVKEAFRKLVWQHHPDKATPEMRTTAEATFKNITTAYETILQGQAGYKPPPPGAAPNVQNAEAYWHAHTADGRVPWGKYAGNLCKKPNML